MALAKVKLEYLCCCCHNNETELRNIMDPQYHDGKTEIYPEMIADCFGIELKIRVDDAFKICETCIQRLRDAIELRHQVQIAYDRIQESANMVEKNPDLKNDEPKLKAAMYKSNMLPVNNSENDNSTWRNREGVTKENSIECEVKIEELEIEYSKPKANDVSECKDKNSSSVVPKNRKHKCLYCLERFSNKYSKMKHMYSVHNVNEPTKYSCEVCFKYLANKGSLSRHMNSIHLRENKYVCDTCAKIFYSKTNIAKHMAVHSGKKDFHCHLCNKSFARKGVLLLHMKLHSDIHNNFKCLNCSEKFPDEQSKVKHMCSVHNIEPSKVLM